MLRSTIVRGTSPILTAAWSPDSSTILYSQGSQLLLQSLNSSTKSRKVINKIISNNNYNKIKLNKLKFLFHP